MNEGLKHFFPLVLTVLCVVCGITLLTSVWDIGSAFSNLTQNGASTTIAEQWNTQSNEPFPTLLYTGNSLTVGESIPISDLFLLQTATGNVRHYGGGYNSSPW